MALDVTMPRLSDSMEEGTILKWLAQPGDEVRRGQELVEIETDKANMTYEADADGTLLELLAAEGDTLPVGATIARIGDPGKDAQANGGADGASAEPAGQTESRRPAMAVAETPLSPARSDERSRPRVKASPVARRLATELGIELEALAGSGPSGRIVKADVEAAMPAAAERVEAEPRIAAEPRFAPEPARAAEPPPRAPEPGAKGEVTVRELSRLERTVARRMAESKATAPEFTLTVTVDMTACVELRSRLKELSEQPPSYNDMIVKASARAAREHPRVNGAYRDGHLEFYSRINIGLAVAAEDALLVPTLFDADRKSLGEIARESLRLAERARNGQLTEPELAGGTLTLSNLGMYGIDSFTAIINPPQAAILTVGSLARRPAVGDDGRIVARDQLELTLVCDHRILYGVHGAQYLARVRELLEQPLTLAL
jgi:pyruvate dehydrogenase E2 component (dihydrolipoamide acetyltransferase)